MTDEPDITRLLGAAVAAEPPLTLDRDEVFGAGRTLVRKRRRLAAAGVAAGVVAVVVGVAWLSVLAGGRAEQVQQGGQDVPFSSVAGDAPPGPVLPLPPSNANAPTAVQKHADELTAEFGTVNELAGYHQREPLVFRVADGGYRASAGFPGAGGEGSIAIRVDHRAAGLPVTCDDVADAPGSDCTVKADWQGPYRVVSSQDAQGVRYLTLTLQRKDGTEVSITVTNARPGEATPTASSLPANESLLLSIATKPRLSFG